MKKADQIKINQEVAAAINQMQEDIKKEDIVKVRRLRSCSAEVAESEHYYILRSYNTIVAFIDKRSDTLYDALRLVYGYTATSAKHIAKFNQDYSRDPYAWNCSRSLRYYPV